MVDSVTHRKCSQDMKTSSEKSDSECARTSRHPVHGCARSDASLSHLQPQEVHWGWCLELAQSWRPLRGDTAVLGESLAVLGMIESSENP